MPVKFQDAAASAKDYLEAHGLLRYVQSMLHAVIQVKPKDPYAFMMEQLGASKTKAAAVRSRSASRPTSRPTSAIGGRTLSRPTSALPSGRQPVPPVEPPPGPGESSPSRIPQVGPPGPPGPPTGPPPTSKSPPPEPKPPEEPPVKEEDVFAPLATPPPLPDPSAAGCDLEPKPTAPQPLAEPSPTGTQPKPSDEPVREEDSVEDLRLHMRDVLEKAHSTGQLAKAVEVALASGRDCAKPQAEAGLSSAAEAKPSHVEAQPPQLADNNHQLKREMRALLEESVQNGKLEEAIKKTQVKRDREPQAQDMQAKEDLERKAKLRELLSTSSENGELAAALEKIAAQRSTDELQQIKGELRHTLANALEDERLSAALPCKADTSSSAAPAVADEMVKVKANLRNALATAASTGQLEEALQKITDQMQEELKAESQPPAPTADKEEVKAEVQPSASADAANAEVQPSAQAKMQDLVLAGFQSGKLAEALKAAKVLSRPGSPVAKKPALMTSEALPTDEEIEEVKVRLRSVMAEATKTGALTEALQSMLKNGNSELPGPAPGLPPASDAELEAIKAKLRAHMQEATESGKLAETLARMYQNASSGSGAAEDADMEGTKAKLRSLLTEAVESGQLSQALAAVGTKRGASQEAGIEETRAKLKNLMRQATESGRLEEALRSMAEAKGNGKLEEPLQNIAGKKAPPTKEEVEETKAKLRAIMQEATESGKLEEALKKVTTKRDEPANSELEDVKANLRNALQAASDAGTLEAALQKVLSAKQGATEASQAVGGESHVEVNQSQQELGSTREETPDLHGTIDRLTKEMDELRRSNELLEERLAEAARRPQP
eukprot:TRINITY_DN2276_c0_g1_i1.p1 TRINITY_DN2276_c0_g1~~TRINITY_DN2276_c0_g1_i1.p1  ORF type:complete len:968 (+),score=272.70 TRINITY_DN2276_c0_g1_i1:383-2905(+)